MMVLLSLDFGSDTRHEHPFSRIPIFKYISGKKRISVVDADGENVGKFKVGYALNASHVLPFSDSLIGFDHRTTSFGILL